LASILLLAACPKGEDRKQPVTNMTPTPIFGIVRDEAGRPVANARASFVSGPGNLPDVAMLTDAAGKFSLTAPGAGEFVLQIYADGFQAKEISVSVRSGEQKNVEVRLSK